MIVFNHGGVYRGGEVNDYSIDPDPTVLTRARYDRVIEAFDSTGYHAEDSATAVQQALDAGAPALVKLRHRSYGRQREWPP